MKTLTLTSKDFNDNNKYIGTTDLSNFDGHLTIEGGLGMVKFKSISVTGSIVAGAGSGIKAGEDIKAGLYINAGSYIKAGSDIKAGWGIKAGSYIKAGRGIKAGKGISAGWDIKAGSDIKAGRGIVAGLSIVCRDTLTLRYRLFAGIAPWIKESTPEDMKVQCSKLEGGGVVIHGNLIETGDAHAERRAQLEADKQRIEEELAALGGTTNDWSLAQQEVTDE